MTQLGSATSPLWQDLMQQALVGTQRLEALSTASLPQPLQGLLAEGDAALTPPADAHAPTVRLLRAAAAVGAWQRAGYEPPLGQVGEQTLAPQDTQAAPARQSVVDALAAALREGEESLIRQGWHLLARADLRLPERLLPSALDAAARDSALREDLQRVLGARGLWLAQQNPVWKFAAGTDQKADPEQLWSEGSFEQRLAVLREERARDPAAARARFEAALKELNAKERLAMLELLRVQLSMADEALLERLLTDRGSEVRQLAAELLSALPQSAHSQRVTAWLAPLLVQSGDTWTIEPPEKENPDWARDGIALKAHGFFKGGDRAWWLYQLVRMSPSAWWTDTLGLSPEALFEWASKTEWKRSLRDGLLEAAVRTPSRDWLALLTSLQQNRFALDSLHTLLAAMPLADREAYWSDRLKAAPTSVMVLIRMDELMLPGEQLSAPLSGQVVATLAAALAADGNSTHWSVRHDLSQAMTAAALWMAPEVLPALVSMIDKAAAPEATNNVVNDVQERVHSIASIRLTLGGIAA